MYTCGLLLGCVFASRGANAPLDSAAADGHGGEDGVEADDAVPPIQWGQDGQVLFISVAADCDERKHVATSDSLHFKYAPPPINTTSLYCTPQRSSGLTCKNLMLNDSQVYHVRRACGRIHLAAPGPCAAGLSRVFEQGGVTHRSCGLDPFGTRGAVRDEQGRTGMVL